MSLSLIVFAGFYPPARYAIQYADTLAQAVEGRLVLLHVNRASLFDPNDLIAQGYHQQELERQTDTAAILSQQAQGLRAGNYPLLVVAPNTVTDHPPRRILIAADREPFKLTTEARALRPLLQMSGAEVFVAHVSSGVEDDEGCALALRAVQASSLVDGLPVPKLRGYEHDDYADGLLAAVQDTQADLVVVLARQRSFLGELFHRSVTARLLTDCPVPVLVLPVAAEVLSAESPESAEFNTAAQNVTALLHGLAPAS